MFWCLGPKAIQGDQDVIAFGWDFRLPDRKAGAEFVRKY